MFRDFLKRLIGLIFSNIVKSNHVRNDSLTIFVFHDVTDDPSHFSLEKGLAVSLETFRMQCIWIKNNFSVVHPKDLIAGINLPSRAAIISFDDGFLGSFSNGLPILRELELPSVLFLNMCSIINKKPLISAIACYLEDNTLLRSSINELKKPLHLNLSPDDLYRFIDRNPEFDFDLISKYQGAFVDIETLKYWAGNSFVSYGNHLYEHWNAIALSVDQLEEQYAKNNVLLQKFDNFINLFAFTNGQPNTCFTERDVSLIKKMGAAKAFSCYRGVNKKYKNEFMLGRISLGPNDNSLTRLWFRVAREIFRDTSFKLRELYFFFRF